MKSRASFARRQKSIEERLDPRWQPDRLQPVLEGGNIRYEVSERAQAIACGGLGMLQQVVEVAGLRTAIDDGLHLLQRHRPYHESDHVLTLVYNILSGGRCPEELELRRRDEGFLEALGAHRLPDPTTAGDFLRRFERADVVALLGAMNRSQANVWSTRPASERQLATLDIDGTIVETSGECKEGMDVSYDGRWGFGPLVVSLAQSREVLSVVNRPASRPSHDGAVEWIDRDIRWAREQAGFARVRLRGDSDFSLTANFDRWTAAGVEFVFGMDANRHFVRRAEEELAAAAWKRLRRRKAPVRRRATKVKQQVIEQRGFRDLAVSDEQVAELPYRPRKATGTYRLIVLRKRIRVTQGQLPLQDEIRYFFYVTNIPRRALSPAGVVRESNARCEQENLIEQLKNGVRATRMPVREFVGNWAYLAIGALAWNIKSWAALLLPAELGARTLLRMEMRRFHHEIVLLPAQILRSGRRLIFRLLAINPWVPLLLEGTQRLQRRCLA